MKRFAAVTFLFCASLIAVAWPTDAYAGETYLGSIVSAAGADTTNISTASPFSLPPAGLLITMQCNATAYIAVDDLTAVTSTRGVTIPASALFLTRLTGKKTSSITITLIQYRTAVIRIAGPAAVTCNVWARNGDE